MLIGNAAETPQASKANGLHHFILQLFTIMTLLKEIKILSSNIPSFDMFDRHIQLFCKDCLQLKLSMLCLPAKNIKVMWLSNSKLLDNHSIQPQSCLSPEMLLLMKIIKSIVLGRIL
ncbi:unnamed protein product [Paramecium octaurelia]|uniref:Uncharacterized protein n=1 Tax=Paramecium octaurelia TaxID=43137 RepID=A0A8S1XZ15_PAROT|nr:unnamed protein product [Paramecium octaurelia]